MKKMLICSMMLSAAVLLGGCGKKEETSAPAPAPETVVTDETSSEEGFIEPENTEEETGEIESEAVLEGSVETDGDALILKMDADKSSGFSWKYESSDPSVIDLESETYVEAVPAEEGSEPASDSSTFIFRAKKEGTAVIVMNYVSEEEEAAEEEAVEEEAEAEEAPAEDAAEAEEAPAEDAAEAEEAPAEDAVEAEEAPAEDAVEAEEAPAEDDFISGDMVIRLTVEPSKTNPDALTIVLAEE